MKQTRHGKIACAARGCGRVATVRLTPPERSDGRQPYPVYYCSQHAQAVPSVVRSVAFQHGFTVMMDFSSYFKDVVEDNR